MCAMNINVSCTYFGICLQISFTILNKLESVLRQWVVMLIGRKQKIIANFIVEVFEEKEGGNVFWGKIIYFLAREKCSIFNERL